MTKCVHGRIGITPLPLGGQAQPHVECGELCVTRLRFANGDHVDVCVEHARLFLESAPLLKAETLPESP